MTLPTRRVCLKVHGRSSLFISEVEDVMKAIGVMWIMGIMLFCLALCGAANAQGRVTFDDPWINYGTDGFVLDYYDGFSFRVVLGPPHVQNEVKQVGAFGPAGYPHNGTPFAAFINTFGTPQYVLFARTNAARFGDHGFTAGAPFGLISVDLADPIAPSPETIEIVFNGFRADGSMISQSFFVGGGGSSSFQTFYFGSEFAHGLIRVEIPSARWAMDNLVWVPEPRVGVIWILGILVGLRLFTPGNGGRSR